MDCKLNSIRDIKDLTADDILTCLSSNYIQPAFQSVIDLKSGKKIGEVAYARITMPDGEIDANRFIDQARSENMLHHIDHMIITKCFNYCLDAVLNCRDHSYFVHVSYELLSNRDVMESIIEQAHLYYSSSAGLLGPDKPMVLLVDGDELICYNNEIVDLLKPLLDFGFRLGINNFTPGMLSHSPFKVLPIQYLFLHTSQNGQLDALSKEQLLSDFNRSFPDLQLVVVSKNIETEKMTVKCQQAGIDLATGYHFGKPVLHKA